MRSLVLCISVALMASSVLAQARFSELVKRYLPDASVYTPSAVLSDVDADGDLDLVLTTNEQDRLYLNDGAGIFADETASRLPADFGTGTSVLSEDVDADGDPDLVIGNRGSQNRLYLNDGAGNFSDVTATRMPGRREATTALAFGDVDGDGDGDLVVANDFQQNRLYLNDGRGFFHDATSGRMPWGIDVALGVALTDVEGDGDLDVVFATKHQNLLYLNDSTGSFSDATTQLPQTQEVSNAVVATDTDGDGDVDLVFGNGGQQNRLYLNNSLGRFFDGTSGRLPIALDQTEDVVNVDYDDDGDEDLVVGNERDARLLLNDGSGAFVEIPLPPHRDQTMALAVGDVDNDADVDCLLANADDERLYLSNGVGVFAVANPPRTAHGGLGSDIVPADVDGDGDLDLVFALVAPGLYLNDGLGHFAAAPSGALPPQPPPPGQSRHLACLDVEGDGDVDLVAAYWRNQNRLYLNDGAGVFADATAARMPVDQDATWAVAAFDVEGDGDLDLVFGGLSEQTRLHLNDGNGFFADATATSLPASVETVGGLVAVDVDGDGDLDLVLASLVGQSSLYLNDGSGRFSDATAARMPPDNDDDDVVAVGDVDSDGDLDLVFGGGYGVRLYLNDGLGTFVDATAVRLPAAVIGVDDIAVGDFDGDGHLDLALSGAVNPSRIYRNDGTGAFFDVTAPWVATPTSRSTAIAAVDADGDGDLDLMYAGEVNELRFNLSRHLDAPLRARVGWPFLLEIHARDTDPAHVDLGAPFISTARASLALPWGTFGLDPTELVALPPAAISKPTGLGSVSFRMPNEPALVGVTIYSQALLVLGPTRAVLTNVTASTILDV
ncbi:MAG: VCBS repeat-containing protein [Planctomycetota bacterium]